MKYLILLPPLIFCAIGLVLAFQMVPPNATTGFRTGRTLSNEAAWYAVNANVGWSLVLSGLVAAAVIWHVFALDLNLSVKCLIATATLVCAASLTVIVGTMS
ncbi:SdpI family protein [Sinirhodobacter huangdaonensis]|uniref:SdpI family protein n=1 Tax=Paenirhodobacter huangdaonensis TaxID=2501515 RepID=A0A443LLU5_9RHOB|nr:SdpI family protein [Sinirhodobacter huangdaonensis]RWR50075.1 SdpI family protein [Sinirhodobacter huangdaonensis]